MNDDPATSDLEDAMIQLAIAETALVQVPPETIFNQTPGQTTGTWVAVESIRRARASIKRHAEQPDDD